MNNGARKLSPRRNTTRAADAPQLVAEQLDHFGIDAQSEFGTVLARIVERLYECHDDMERLWQVTLQSIGSLDRADRIAYFNAKRFLSFQFAKLLDTLQNPSRRVYQSLAYSPSTLYAKGPYPVFDNVTAIFAANPVIARTATYLYAFASSAEVDAFVKECYLDTHRRYIESKPSLSQLR